MSKAGFWAGVHVKIVGKNCMRKRMSFRPKAHYEWAEVEKSALKADLSARPFGLGRGDKRRPTIKDCDNRE